MSEKMITVIGDGAWGTVCAVMFAENGQPVRLFSAFEQQAQEMRDARENRRFMPGLAFPENLTVAESDAQAFEGASLILNAVPTQFIRNVWERLAEYYPGDVPVCSVAKGIENRTLLRPTQVIQQILGCDESLMSVLSGPTIAPEIAEHKPATATVASLDAALAERVQQAVSRPYFRVYTNADPVGVELAGATKNVIAIAAGLIDGLNMGDNAKAALVTRGLSEICRLGKACGAEAQTFFGLSGVGDLVTTCISPIGRNRSFGQAVARGQKVQEVLADSKSVVEGVATTQSVLELAASVGVEMPITQAIYAVIFEGRSPKDAVNELMLRPLTAE